MYRHKNFARSTLSAGITSGATSFSVATGEGAKFPQSLQYVTIWNSTDFAVRGFGPNAEIVKVSSRATRYVYGGDGRARFRRDDGGGP
jgi:hypothetical protein